MYAFVRETEQQRYMVILNFAKAQSKIKLTGRIGKWVAGTHSTHGSGEPPEAGELALAPYEGRVYEILRGDA